jgi:CubicO group peptidase (beta-lactamase class C family)
MTEPNGAVKGICVEGFEAVGTCLEQVISRGGGAAICVYHRGEKVVDVWGGMRDEEGTPWEEDTMAMSFSTSKGVMSTLVHQLADRGLLDYDDRVSKHWPEFGQAGKESITIRQVLSHRAGLPDITAVVEEASQILDWKYMVDALARATPQVKPGRPSAYHALTFGWLAGEIAQRASGRTIPDLLRTELAEPLGLDGLYIGAPEEAKARAAVLRRGDGPVATTWPKAIESLRVLERVSSITRAAGLRFDPDLMARALMIPGNAEILFEDRVLDVPIPAANGLFTARSLARLYAALGAGGSLDGVRILSEDIVKQATEIQTMSRDRVLVIRMGWRLGYHTAFSTKGQIEGSFGHFGFGGSGAFADPKRQLAIALVNNSTGGSPIGDGRIGRIAEVSMRCAKEMRGGSSGAA